MGWLMNINDPIHGVMRFDDKKEKLIKHIKVPQLAVTEENITLAILFALGAICKMNLLAVNGIMQNCYSHFMINTIK